MPILPTLRPSNQAGSGFTNLQQYLQANRANRLGQTIAGGVQQAGEAARGAITQAGQQFQAGAQAEKQRLSQAGQQAGQLLQDPTQANEQQVQQFQNVLGAESKGPAGVSNAEQLRSQAQQAQQLGQAGSTQQGRFGLLQRYVGRGNQYGLGQQRLDQMLLGQTGQQQLRSARAGTAGLEQQAQQQITGAEAQGQELRGQARQLAEKTMGQLGEAATSYDTAMQQKLAQQEAAAKAAIEQFKDIQNAPVQLSADQIKQLADISGGILKEGSTLYGANIYPYLQMNKLYDVKQAAQSQEDLKKAQALAKLGGQYFAPTEQYKALAPYIQSPELAGKFAANQFDITSLSDLNKAIEQQRQAYEAATANERNVIENTSRRIGGEQETLRDIYAASQGITGADNAVRGQRVELPTALDWAKGLTPSQLPYDPSLSNLSDSQLRAIAAERGIDESGNSVPTSRAATANAMLNAQYSTSGSKQYNLLKGLQDTLAEHQKVLAGLPEEYKAFRTLKALQS